MIKDQAEFETPEDAGSGEAGEVKLWLSAIEVSSQEEESWRKEAEETLGIFRNGDGRHIGSVERQHTFNVLYSNVETIVPAIYNSTPIPDVRTRFSKKDPVAKEAGDIIERALTYDLDVDDMDTSMEMAIKDGEIVGRGVTRVRYVPYFTDDQETGEQIAWEEVPTEHVPWANFRRGPGRIWNDVPWIAFELFLTREQLLELNPELGGQVQMDAHIIETAQDKQEGEPVADIYKRARVWEIWCRDSKTVKFLATGLKDKWLRVDDDPYGLTAFYPIPRPYVSIETSDTLCPIPPYRMYKDQAEELSRVTRRITSLVQMLKVRGVRDAQITEFENIADADDGEFVAMQDATALYAQGGSFDKAIWMMPIEVIQQVVAGLYVQREQIKQVIYEITGISDILRGASDPRETLGAQNIKAQFGSQRVQRKQKEASRYARDILRLKAELIANKFQPETLLMMTGVQLPSAQDKQMAQMQAQQAQQQQQPVPPELQEVLEKPTFEEVLQLLRSDVQRQYRIDVESDSTIRADLSRSQEMMNMFMQAAGSFVQSIGPAVQTGMLPGDVALEIFKAFCRNFKLGKAAEDALEGLGEREQQPDPAQQAQQQAAEAQQQQMQMDMQSKQMDMQMKQQEHEFKLAEMQAELQMKQQEMGFKQEELALKEREMQIKERLMLLDAQVKERTATINAQSIEHKASINRQTMEDKARMQREPEEA